MTASEADRDSDDAAVQADFAVLAGRPTAEELAAVTAVIRGLLEEQGDSDARSLNAGPSAWSRSQRQLRSPLTPGFGAWRGFSA